ncbi:MAG: metallophosphoesterase [Spirochaetales bacterium]|nr:metallophosphoesterase [Spirochaetales bacterium]
MSELPDKEEYMDKIDHVTYILKSIDKNRELDDAGLPGGIVTLYKDIPTIIVPDLHGRVEFIHKLLNWKIDNVEIIELLSQKKIQVVCVGDGFHSEGRGKNRWLSAEKEYASNFKTHSHIDDEMSENLELMELIMELKIMFPNYFTFLKGNHENIKNENSYGNHAFGKFTKEGEIVKEWVLKFYGEDFLNKYSEFEYNLPLMAVGSNFLISHSEPRSYYTKDEIINFRTNFNVTEGLTWTANSESTEGSVEKLLESLVDCNSKIAYYFVGHRPVSGAYNTRANGKLVQIHNPVNYGVAFIKANEEINLESIILDINGEISNE